MMLSVLLAAVLCGQNHDPGWFVAQRRSEPAVLRAASAFQAGTEHFHKGDMRKALEGFLKVAEEAPEVTDGWTNAGVCLEALGRKQEAGDLYRTGLASGLTSRPGRLHHYLCNMLVQSFEADGDTQARESAVEHCTEAVNGSPEDAQAHFNLGALRAQRLEYTLAVKHFSHALKLRPGDAQGLQNLANVLLRAGDASKALTMLRGLLHGGHNSSAVNRLIGTVLSTTEPVSAAAKNHMMLGLHQHFAEVGRDDGGCPIRVVEESFSERGAEARRVLSGGAEYGTSDPPRTFAGAEAPPAASARRVFRDKSAWVVTHRGRYLAGPSGCVIEDCAAHVGDHSFNSRCADEIHPEHFNRGRPGRLKTSRGVAGVPVASALQAKLHNHYHWMCEGLSRVVVLAETVLREDSKAVLLVPSGGGVIDEALQLLGEAVVPLKRVVRWRVAEFERRHLPLLYTVHFSQDSAADDQNDDPWYTFFPPAAALRRVRELLRAGIKQPVGSPLDAKSASVVHVSRADAGARVVLQEKRLVALLREHVGSRLKVFLATGMTLAQQLSVFRSAAVVVGPHGAGLANCIACDPGTHLVVLPMSPYVDNVWGHMAAALDLQYWLVPGLSSFYYTHYNATPHRRKQVLLTLQAALEDISAEHGWASEVLRRPVWGDIDTDIVPYEDTPAGEAWRDGGVE